MAADPLLSRALDAATSLVPTPRTPDDHPCDCATCYEQAHLETERRTWRELDAARRAAQQLRDNPPAPVRRTPK